MKKLAIGLYSGGLDSILAARLIVDLGFYTILVKFVSPIFEERQVEIGNINHILPSGYFSLRKIEMGEDYSLLLQSPKYGYGKNMNPCLDCKIFMMKKAGQILKEQEGAFVFSGEVVGQRPMSQRKDAMRIIERESGLNRYLLRPLSAQLLPPTIAEESGLINREALFNISGRSRKRQIELAQKFGISGYPGPGGGCLLTDVSFARRFKMILEEKNKVIQNDDLQLLKIGRHFMIRSGIRLIVGRNHSENQKILSLGKKKDWIFQVIGAPGPISLGRGNLETADFECAAAITARYSDAKTQEEISVGFKLHKNSHQHILKVSPLHDEVLKNYRI